MAWSAARYRRLKWLTLVLAGMFVAVFLISIGYDFGLAWNSGMVGWVRGRIFVAMESHERPPPSALFWRANSEIRWKLSISQGNQVTLVQIPFWIPLMVALAAAWFFHRKARAIMPGRCRSCSYDLTGNTSGVCPECGIKFELKANGSPQRGDGV